MDPAKFSLVHNQLKILGRESCYFSILIWAFLFQFSTKCGYQGWKMHVRIANREFPDQNASLEAVWSGSAQFG